MFENISNRVHFPDIETAILDFWKKNDIFKKSLDNRKGAAPYVFYDGPPFATGLPHYGHLLAGTIKDIIPRYQTMKGKYVERTFGWDCHGLPVEMEMQNELKLNSSKEIEEYGIGNFNEACRSIVQRYTDEWQQTVERMGRWVEFEGGYKTMDKDFMESVWWVFKELFKKGLIYEGYKVLPYSWKAGTTLSNFEANLNYKDVQDPAVTIKFQTSDEENTFFLAWTTTPWTLISNLGLCVNENLDYVKIKDKPSGEYYYMGKSRVSAYYKDDSEYEIIEELTGKDLAGKTYLPLYDFAQSEIDISNCFRILTDDYVSDTDGTGIVHQAPAYGEDDSRVCQKYNIPVFDAVDEGGNMQPIVSFASGKNIKDADKDIIKELKSRNLVVQHGTITHSYPFCWRTDTPLIYKAISTWFVRVSDIKDNMAKNNESISWMPTHIKEGRMGKGIASAPDWNISRNRYWGTPIPIWKSEEGDILCIGSVKELEDLCGHTIDDLHKHLIDPITITKDGKLYTRIPEVLDCWFESGSMPMAQVHYPFENKEKFEKNFPAQFIAEGLDQTRGWFYTLITIGAALFKKPPFQNVIVNGLILAEDGKKMSKRLKNYPAPDKVINELGADALRMYMISSAVVRAESLKFSEAGIKDIIKSIILPLWNSFSFFTSYANIDNWSYKKMDIKTLENPLDRWILSYMEQLVAEVTENMDNYDLQKAVPPFIKFIERLTNWYIRRSRRRFWKSENDGDKNQAYFTLYTVLLKLSKVIAPFMPFTSEKIFQVLRTSDERESVHLCDFPVEIVENRDIDLEKEMDLVESVVGLGRSLRLNHRLKVRQPLSEMHIISKNSQVRELLSNASDMITDELNIKSIVFNNNEGEFVSLSSKANFKTLGAKYGKQVQVIAKAIAALSPVEIEKFEKNDSLEIDIESEKITLLKEDVLIIRIEKEGMVVANEGEVTVVLNTELTEELILEGIARDFVNITQKHRKEIGLEYTDHISICFNSDDELVQKAITTFADYIQKETLADKIENTETNKASTIEAELGSYSCKLSIAKI